jgi:hypothetical protein
MPIIANFLVYIRRVEPQLFNIELIICADMVHQPHCNGRALSGNCVVLTHFLLFPFAYTGSPVPTRPMYAACVNFLDLFMLESTSSVLQILVT